MKPQFKNCIRQPEIKKKVSQEYTKLIMIIVKLYKEFAIIIIQMRMKHFTVKKHSKSMGSNELIQNSPFNIV